MNSTGAMDPGETQPPAARRWIAGALALSAAATVLFLFDPGQHGFYPRCGFHALTGWDCPGCGGLRAAHQLLHGHVAAAWALNPLVLLLPVPGALIAFARHASPGAAVRLRGGWPAWLGVALLLFCLARNLLRLRSSSP